MAKVRILSGSEPATLIEKNITANGTYNASADNADGYSSVNVNVSPILISKTITENGTYTAHSEPGAPDGYSAVTVDVHTDVFDEAVDYIQFNGNPQYFIDLGMAMSSDFDIEVLFDIDTYKDYNPIIGTGGGAQQINLTQYNQAYYGYNGISEVILSQPLTGKHSIHWNNTNLLFDNVIVGVNSPYSSAYHLWLGRRSDIDNQGAYNGKINEVIIKSIASGLTLYHFKPWVEMNLISGVVRKGIKDIINDTFIESSLNVGIYS